MKTFHVIQIVLTLSLINSQDFEPVKTSLLFVPRSFDLKMKCGENNDGIWEIFERSGGHAIVDSKHISTLSGKNSEGVFICRSPASPSPRHRLPLWVTSNIQDLIANDWNEKSVLKVGSSLHKTCRILGDIVPSNIWIEALAFGMNKQIAGSVLSIENVTMDHAGLYFCNVDISSNRGSRVFTLIVEDKPILVKSDSFQTRLKFTYPSPIEVECPLKSNPQAEYVWYKKTFGTDKEVEIARNKSMNRLSVHNYKPEDWNAYLRCVATNIHGTSVVDFDVKVQYAPMYENGYSANDEKIAVRREGHSSILYCPIKCQPRCVYEWHFDRSKELKFDEAIKNATSKHFFIEKLGEKQFGKYICVGRNALGMLKYSINMINYDSIAKAVTKTTTVKPVLIANNHSGKG